MKGLVRIHVHNGGVEEVAEVVLHFSGLFDNLLQLFGLCVEKEALLIISSLRPGLLYAKNWMIDGQIDVLPKVALETSCVQLIWFATVGFHSHI